MVVDLIRNVMYRKQHGGYLEVGTCSRLQYCMYADVGGDSRVLTLMEAKNPEDYLLLCLFLSLGIIFLILPVTKCNV